MGLDYLLNWFPAGALELVSTSSLRAGSPLTAIDFQSTSGFVPQLLKTHNSTCHLFRPWLGPISTRTGRAITTTSIVVIQHSLLKTRFRDLHMLCCWTTIWGSPRVQDQHGHRPQMLFWIPRACLLPVLITLAGVCHLRQTLPMWFRLASIPLFHTLVRIILSGV